MRTVGPPSAPRPAPRATINSDNHDDWTSIEQGVRSGRIDLLLISPERLNNVRFRREVHTQRQLVGTKLPIPRRR